MTTRAVTLTELQNAGEGKAWKAVWTGLLNGDDGEPVKLPGFSDRSMQVTGTFGSGGSATAQGSNDGGSNYAALRDPSHTTLAFTAAGIKAILEATERVRPAVTAGDETTSLTVTMFFVKPAR